ncbi:hypothetical protein LTR17_004273 [Elasticomyces elasticus]|nr:hypothetical protein LTR17_004273 [Elasticomyces elasticus]
MDKVESRQGSLVREGDGAQTAAERVFGIVELFEMIFDLVDSVDIIRCRGVSKCIYENISESRTLLERLCLRPIASAGSVRHVPVTPSSIRLGTSHACGLTCPHFAGSVEISALGVTEGSPKIWEQLYVSQPPIKVVRIIYLEGCNELDLRFPPPCSLLVRRQRSPITGLQRVKAEMSLCNACRKHIVLGPKHSSFCFGCRKRMVTQIVRREEGIRFGHLLQEMDRMIKTIKEGGGQVKPESLIAFEGPCSE